MKRVSLLVLVVVLMAVLLPSVAMAAPEPKVTICHVPPGNPENAHTITIGAPAVAAHLANHPDDALWSPTSQGLCPLPPGPSE